MLGLDQAGKSCILARLAGEEVRSLVGGSYTEGRKRPRVEEAHEELPPARFADGEIGCFCNTERHLPTNTLSFEGVWLQCDVCDRWCHGECAGMSKEEAEAAESYVCVPCVAEVQAKAEAKETMEKAEVALKEAQDILEKAFEATRNGEGITRD